MAPSEHLDWLDDNIEWFEAISPDRFDHPVPACAGWNVEKVITHLTFGLGLAYPYAARTAPDGADDEPWSEVPWPDTLPTGRAAAEAFSDHMNRCSATFRSMDPHARCWTYDGPGQVGFWFRRAAIETTLHRLDVAEALGRPPVGLVGPRAEARADDAVAEAVEFALPLAARMVGAPSAAMAVTAGETTRVLGDGEVVAELVGEPHAVMASLWGRNHHGVNLTGDHDVAQHWLAVVETAFAGR